MRGRISRVVVAVDAPARATLEGWLRSPATPLGRARRARAILLLAAGARYAHVAERVGCDQASTPFSLLARRTLRPRG